MSASAHASVRPARRPVVSGLPTIQVVPSPAPVRGFVATVISCALIFCAGLAIVFALNTAMVEGAYRIREQQVLLNDLADTRNILDEEIAQASTAVALRARAEELGLEPATDIRHVELSQGVISGGSSGRAE